MATKESKSSEQTTSFKTNDVAGARVSGTVQTQAETVVKTDAKTEISREQHIASELPITQQKVISKEYVPITHEKVITTVPIITEEKVTTGQAVGAGKEVVDLGADYRQGTKAEVEVQTKMRTGIPAGQELVTGELAEKKIEATDFTKDNKSFKAQIQKGI